MASVADAVKVIAAETGEPEAMVTQVARYLVNIGDLPKNVGRRVSSVDEGNVALLLMAIYTSSRHTNAPARAREYANLRREARPDDVTFLTFLTDVLSDLRTSGRIRIGGSITVYPYEMSIEIITTYPLVIVSAAFPLFAERAFEDFGFAGTNAPMTFWPSNKPRRSVTIPGDVLLAIVSHLFGTAENSHEQE